MKTISMKEVTGNVCEMFRSQWALVTAGDEKQCNTMTVSWGGVGVFWNRDVATIYIRPNRYTKKFIDEQECFTISFLPSQYKEALSICGKESGRDGDKFEKAGITKAFFQGVPYVGEAELVFVCKKMCQGDIDPDSFANKEDDAKFYEQKDYHHYYIASIEQVLTV